MQDILTIIILAACFMYVGYKIYQQFKNPGNGCSKCGCSSKGRNCQSCE